MTKKSVIEISNITTAYGKNPVLKGVSLTVSKGTKHIIIGPNGSGKTTLIKVINGLIPKKTGRIKVLDKDLKKSTLTKVRPKIGYIPQNMGLINIYSALDNVILGALPKISTLKSIFKVFPKNQVEKAKKLLEFLGLKSKINKKVYQLSGGEKRRVAIARALMQNPEIILADEILSDLDFVNAELIMNKLKKLKEDHNLTILMVEHDLCIAKKFADKISVIQDGKIKKEISPKDLISKNVCNFFR